MILHLTYFSDGIVDKYRFTDARPPTMPLSTEVIFNLLYAEHTDDDYDVLFYVPVRTAVRVQFLHRECAAEFFSQVVRAISENRSYMDLDIKGLQFK